MRAAILNRPTAGELRARVIALWNRFAYSAWVAFLVAKHWAYVAYLHWPTPAEARLLLAKPIRWLLRPQLFALGVVRVREEGWPAPKAFGAGPTVLVANHVSHLEAMYVAWRTGAAALVDAGALRGYPGAAVVATVARSLNFVAVDRDDPASCAAARELVRRLSRDELREQVLVFPEGEAAFSNGDAVLPFRTRAFAGFPRVQAVAVALPGGAVALDPSLAEHGPSALALLLRMMCAPEVELAVSFLPPRGASPAERVDPSGALYARGVRRELADALGARLEDSPLDAAALASVALRGRLAPQDAVEELEASRALVFVTVAEARRLLRKYSPLRGRRPEEEKRPGGKGAWRNRSPPPAPLGADTAP